MSELIDKQAAINAIEVLHGGCITKDVKNFVRYQLLCVPSAQLDSKTSEWLHDLLQDTIDAGIITEVQAVKIIERAKA